MHCNNGLNNKLVESLVENKVAQETGDLKYLQDSMYDFVKTLKEIILGEYSPEFFNKYVDEALKLHGSNLEEFLKIPKMGLELRQALESIDDAIDTSNQEFKDNLVLLLDRFQTTLDNIVFEARDAYETALDNGFEGTKQEWLEHLEGDSAYKLATLNGFQGTEKEWLDHLEGDSAYEIAVKNGYVGTQSEWLKYIRADGFIQSIQQFATNDSETKVQIPDYGTINSLQGYIKELFENGGIPATPFATKALMEASELVDGDYAVVTEDTDNNGLYVKTADAWVKSGYDPLTQAKVYVDAVDLKNRILHSTESESVIPVLTDADGKVLIGYDAKSDKAIAVGLESNGSLEQADDPVVIPVLVDGNGSVLIGYNAETDSAIIAGIDSTGIVSVDNHINRYQNLDKLEVAEINHFLFYGQSLSIGARGLPIISTSQPYSNLTFDTGTIALTTPTGIKPLIEEDHNGYNGESVVSAACNYVARDNVLSKAKKADSHVLFGSSAGVGGYNIAKLEKSTSTYTNRFLSQVTKAKELTSGTYKVQAVGWVQGENDAVSTKQTPYQEYKSKLSKLVDDMNIDIKAITSQADNIDLLTYQLSSYSATYPDIALAQLDLSNERDDVHLVTPTYHIPHSPADRLHLDNVGYKILGAYFGRAYVQRVIESREPDCIKPLYITRRGNELEVYFKVPTAPLVFDTTNLASTQDMGFKVVKGDGSEIAISNIRVENTSVVITIPENISQSELLEVRYALDHTGAGLAIKNAASGNLRDSTSDKINVLDKDYTLYHVCPHFKLSTNLDKGI